MASHLKPLVGDRDHAHGPVGATITLVEYGDYECPHCGRAHPVVKRVLKRMGDRLRFVFRNFPLAEMHPHALGAATAAEAAALQGKFWEMHDRLFEHQNRLSESDLLAHAQALKLDLDKFKESFADEALEQHIQADFSSGVRSGVNGTPTFFIQGERFEGDWSDEDVFIAALEAAGQ